MTRRMSLGLSRGSKVATNGALGGAALFGKPCFDAAHTRAPIVAILESCDNPRRI